MDYTRYNEVNLDKEQEFPKAFYGKCQDVIDDEEILLTVSTNLNLKGYYNETWLIVARQKLYILEDDKGNIIVQEHLIKDIKDVYLQNFHGVGVIEVKTDKGSFDIARFTRQGRKKFYVFLEYLQKVIRNENFDIKEEVRDNNKESIYGENRCPVCGTPYPRGSTTCSKCTKKSATFRRLLSYLAPYKFRAALILLTTISFSMLNLFPPYLQKIIIDDVIQKKQLNALKWVVLGILCVDILQSAFQGLRTYQLAWLGQKITFDLRQQVYSHLQKLGLSYYDRRMTGAIMNRVTGDTNSIQGFIVNNIQDIIVQVFSLIIITVVLFTMDWQLALIVLIPTPFIFLGTKFYTKRMRKIYRRVWRRRSNVSAVLGGAIPGIKVVKAFTQEEYETDKFKDVSTEYFDEEVRAARHRSIFFPILALSTTLGTLCIWGYGSYRVIMDLNLSLGTLTAFIGYMVRFYQPIQTLSNISGQFQMATTAAERVFEVLDQKPEQELSQEDKMNTDSIELKGNIEFQDVSFGYQTDDDVLKSINFNIKAGEMIGIVGSSGAGKSTLVNLIPRFYEINQGKILIDNTDIKDMDLVTLRSQIGVVLQEPFLFFGTIAENIAYGRPDATMEEIIWASKAANAHKFIMNFPDAYDTLVGERGVGLSGGERQRISIARAILKDPKILILDEATSSVDTETEKLIQEAIDYLIKDRTTIAIAHRLSTLKNADRLIVMENGSIVEEGTHNELMMKEDGVFKKLVEIQSEMADTHLVL